MRLPGQFQACLFFLRKNFKHTKMQIKLKSANKTKTRDQKQQRQLFIAHKNF